MVSQINRLNFLDFLRGISIFIVVMSHSDFGHLYKLDGIIGVIVFFVISGFIITHLLLKEFSQTNRINKTSFYIRRIFRLFPLYYLTLLFYFVLISVLKLDSRVDLFNSSLFYYILYFQEIPFLNSPNIPFALSWSLGIEEKFYLVWPFLFILLVKSKKPVTYLLLLILILYCFLIFDASSKYLARFLEFYIYILFGCIVAFIINSSMFQKIRFEKINSLILIIIFGSIIIGCMGYYLMIAISTALIILYCFLTPKSNFAIIINKNNLISRLGLVSYAVYLNHQTFLNISEKLFETNNPFYLFLLFLLSLGVSFFISEKLIYPFIESKFISLGKIFINKFLILVRN